MSESLSTGQLVFVIFVSILLAVSVICNIMVVVVVLKTPKMINATNIFICNLAVSDILLAGVVIPQKIHDISHADVNYFEGDVLCRIVHFCPLLCIMASIYSMVAISFERKRAIVVTTEHWTTIKQAIRSIPVIWLLSFLFCIPTMVQTNEKRDAKGVILLDILPQGQCINAARYCSTLGRLKEAICRKRPGLLRTGFVLQHDNATPHSATLHSNGCSATVGKFFLILPTVQTWHPLTSTMFGPLKHHLGGMAFETEDDLINTSIRNTRKRLTTKASLRGVAATA
ncbi:cholecystokinin receptor [Plakobranchus ocellatus]|uniref:Cholecystokinin receptor n=1 Tax=Plakobranchus ocellatus TaxID=259542 RepID=A0AAV3YER1_9GAST|nr:cholecystokinin receptor [Plakobranchus ocellatus]